MLFFIATGFVLGCAAGPVIKRQVPAGVPQYAIDYAPAIWLHSQDTYLPSDIAAQLPNTRPALNATSIAGAPDPLTLDNLDTLNDLAPPQYIYLTSKVSPSDNPEYLNGVVPDTSGKTNNAVSSAIIVNDRGSGLVDVFYFYFYANNWGGFYFGQPVNLHVGDWEHSMTRFVNGTPSDMWLSQHGNGQAFTYAATEKYQGGLRPVVYSSNGSHASYATAGPHDHSIPNFNLPLGPVMDFCDKGKLWDPTLSAYYFSYDATSGEFSAYDESTPTAWLYFLGKWGDQGYPRSDPRQSCTFDISLLCKYSGGPTGPIDKQLNRSLAHVCPDNGNVCIVRPFLTAR